MIIEMIGEEEGDKKQRKGGRKERKTQKTIHLSTSFLRQRQHLSDRKRSELP